MRRRIRLRLAGSAAVAVVATVAAALLTTSSAMADVTTQHFASTANASDPYMYKCFLPGVGGGYCMATSEDLNEPGIYPMNRTRTFFSSDGLRWTHSDIAITESQIPGVPANAKHLWAPAVNRLVVGESTTYYLYTPDLTVPGDELSSRIFVSQSSDPLRGFANNVLGQVTGAPTGLYMSDPDIFDHYTVTDPSDDYLLWADGDFGTCGGLSIRKMTSRTSIEPFSQVSEASITINGLGVLGDCGGKGRPYIEGGTLYRFDRWNTTQLGGLPGPYTLVFATKPTFTPPECTAAGQPGTDNSVIAYATSDTVTGPYTYQGIMMCGSTSEWTNQAAIEEVRAANDDWRLIFIYHDGPAPVNDVRSRRMHSECLFVRDGKFVNMMRSPDGAADVNGNRQWCLNGSDIVGIRSHRNGLYLRSDNNGVIRADRSTIGTWEQFTMEKTTGDHLHARNPNRWVQVNPTNGVVLARGAAVGPWEQLTFQLLSPGPFFNTYLIKDAQGRLLSVNSAGVLVVDPGMQSSNDPATNFTFEFISS